jgi:hypothetical protein
VNHVLSIAAILPGNISNLYSITKCLSLLRWNFIIGKYRKDSAIVCFPNPPERSKYDTISRIICTTGLTHGALFYLVAEAGWLFSSVYTLILLTHRISSFNSEILSGQTSPCSVVLYRRTLSGRVRDGRIPSADISGPSGRENKWSRAESARTS